MPAPPRSVILLLACCWTLTAALCVAAEHNTPAAPLQSDGPWRIVLDPGHGGAEPGAAGEGVWEKDLTLEVCRSVARHLEDRGLVVFLTRSGDQALAPPLRAALANYREADLFLAIHFAGKGRGRSRGFELFVAPAVPPGDPLRWDRGQAPYRAASLRWAEALQQELRESVPTFDRGVTVLPNPILQAVACPAVVLELGNLAWPDEVAWLRSRDGRMAVAEAVARAVERFRRSSGQPAPQNR